MVVIVIVSSGNIVALLTAAVPVLLVTRLTVRVLAGALTPRLRGVLQVNLVAFGLRITIANHLPVHNLAGITALGMKGKLFQRRCWNLWRRGCASILINGDLLQVRARGVKLGPGEIHPRRCGEINVLDVRNEVDVLMYYLDLRSLGLVDVLMEHLDLFLLLLARAGRGVGVLAEPSQDDPPWTLGRRTPIGVTWIIPLASLPPLSEAVPDIRGPPRPFRRWRGSGVTTTSSSNLSRSLSLKALSFAVSHEGFEPHIQFFETGGGILAVCVLYHEAEAIIAQNLNGGARCMCCNGVAVGVDAELATPHRLPTARVGSAVH